MATFRGEVVHTWTVQRSPADTLAFFADLDQTVRHTVDLASHERLDARTLRLELTEQRSGKATYTPRYTVRYHPDAAAGVLRWASLDDGGSMQISGEARFSGPEEGPTTLQWAERVAVEVPLNRLLGRAVAPVAEGLIRRGIRGYVDRMIESLEG